MPPSSPSRGGVSPSLQHCVSKELEALKRTSDTALHPLPRACHELIKNLPGNQSCMDCGDAHPNWATVTFGALLCLSCCAKHRHLGVRYSAVRSLTMDHWSHGQILALLEGGNQQLAGFFQRHALDDQVEMRYRTKAARFYRDQMQLHVAKLKGSGIYQGREFSRRRHRRTPSREVYCQGS